MSKDNKPQNEKSPLLPLKSVDSDDTSATSISYGDDTEYDIPTPSSLGESVSISFRRFSSFIAYHTGMYTVCPEKDQANFSISHLQNCLRANRYDWNDR